MTYKTQVDEMLRLLVDLYRDLYTGELPAVYAPMGVFKRLYDWGVVMSEHRSLALAALGHDAVARRLITVGEMRERFGPDAADLMQGMCPPGDEPRRARVTRSLAYGEAPLALYLLKSAERVARMDQYVRRGRLQSCWADWVESSGLYGAARRRAPEVAGRYGEAAAGRLLADWDRIAMAVESRPRL